MFDFHRDRRKADRILRWFYREMHANDLAGLSAEIAYFSLLSIFPLLIVVS
ncbi:MAG: hypothetical protein GF334_13070, partial [Candidatus Altiarchaeales archaeon]|nr:hypothetical protein [Candidatus Altiarchaeales archaeon]